MADVSLPPTSFVLTTYASSDILIIFGFLLLLKFGIKITLSGLKTVFSPFAKGILTFGERLFSITGDIGCVKELLTVYFPFTLLS